MNASITTADPGNIDSRSGRSAQLYSGHAARARTDYQDRVGCR